MSSFLAAKHVLEMPSVNLSAAIDEEKERIDWAQIKDLAELFSTGERVMVDVALQLWNGATFDNARVSDLFCVDDDNLRRVLEAICIKKDLTFTYDAGVTV